MTSPHRNIPVEAGRSRRNTREGRSSEDSDGLPLGNPRRYLESGSIDSFRTLSPSDPSTEKDQVSSDNSSEYSYSHPSYLQTAETVNQRVDLTDSDYLLRVPGNFHNTPKQGDPFPPLSTPGSRQWNYETPNLSMLYLTTPEPVSPEQSSIEIPRTRRTQSSKQVFFPALTQGGSNQFQNNKSRPSYAKLGNAKKATETTALIPRVKKKKSAWSCELLFIVVLVNIGGFLIGYVGASLNPILEDVYTSCDFQSPTLKGLLVSSSAIGGFIGAAIGTPSTQRFGRKYSIILSDVFMIVGCLLVLCGPGGDVNIPLVISSRLIAGIGVGLAGMSIPVYLTEIAPAKIRGGIMIIHSASQMLGQVIALGICAIVFIIGLDTLSVFWWKWVIVASAAVAVVHTCIMLSFPKSPRWLVEVKRRTEAMQIMVRLGTEPDEETAKQRIKKIDQTYRSVSKKEYGLWNNMCSSAFRDALFMGGSLAVIQQFSGINTIMNYSSTIIESVGLSKNARDAVYWSMPIVGIQFVAGMASIKFIDKFGRKPLARYSLLGVTFSLLLLTASSYVVGEFDQASPTSQNQQYVLLQVSRWCCLMAMILYIVTYAPGLGPVPITVNSEIFPTHLRGLGGSVFIMITWLASSIITLVFPIVESAAGMGSAFCISFAFSLLGLVFVEKFLIETKGDLESFVRTFSKAHLALTDQRVHRRKSVPLYNPRKHNRT